MSIETRSLSGHGGRPAVRFSADRLFLWKEKAPPTSLKSVDTLPLFAGLPWTPDCEIKSRFGGPWAKPRPGFASSADTCDPVGPYVPSLLQYRPCFFFSGARYQKREDRGWSQAADHLWILERLVNDGVGEPSVGSPSDKMFFSPLNGGIQYSAIWQGTAGIAPFFSSSVLLQPAVRRTGPLAIFFVFVRCS